MEIEEHPRNRKVPIPDRWEIVHLRRQGHTFPDIAQLLSRAEYLLVKIYIKDGLRLEMLKILNEVEDLQNTLKKRKIPF